MKVYAFAKKYISYLKGKNNPQEVWRLFLKSRGTASAEDVIKEAAAHCDIKPMKLREAMEALGDAITHFVQMGFDVRVPGLGNICLQLRAKEVATAEECTRDTFKNESQPISVTILPTEGLKDAVKGIELHVLKPGQTEESVSDNDEQQGEQNSGEQNQGGGTQQPATKYTLTLKRANGTVISTTELEAGAAITYPTATSGYMWPADAPTVMPAQATTVTEVVDDDPNVL